VANCNGNGFYLRYYNKNSKAAIAAASVLGEGGEEGIHGLEVENHDRNSPNGHNHGVHEPLNRDDLKHYIDLSPPPSHYHYGSENHQPNVAQRRFEEALKHDIDIEDYIYITELESEIYELVHEHNVVIFSKSYCPYSQRAKRILSQYDILPRPVVFEVDGRDDADEIKQILTKFTYQSTFPNIFINGISIGGSEELAIMNMNGRLQELLAETGVLDDSDLHYDVIHSAL
jgi:glutaredoxin